MTQSYVSTRYCYLGSPTPERAQGVTLEEPTAGNLHGGVREGRELTGPRSTYTRTKLETADRAKEDLKFRQFSSTRMRVQTPVNSRYHQYPMDDFPKLWVSIRADLHRACTLLPGSSEDSGSFHQYHEFVEQNELELACDALEESAKDRAVSSDSWLALRDAAQKMGLGENAARYEKLAKAGL